MALAAISTGIRTADSSIIISPYFNDRLFSVIRLNVVRGQACESEPGVQWSKHADAFEWEAPIAVKTSDATSFAMLNLQKDVLDAYEQASRSWLGRMQSEVGLWYEFTAKLTSTRSVPEALETYQKFMTQRMQMAAEDGRQLVEDWQKIGGKIGRSLSGAWPAGTSSD